MNGDLIDKYYPLITIEEANGALTQHLLEKDEEKYVVQVEVENLSRKNAERWIY